MNLNLFIEIYINEYLDLKFYFNYNLKTLFFFLIIDDKKIFFFFEV